MDLMVKTAKTIVLFLKINLLMLKPLQGNFSTISIMQQNISSPSILIFVSFLCTVVEKHFTEFFQT